MTYSYENLKLITLETVKEIIDNSEITDTDIDLFDAYDLDSLMLVDLIINLEEKLDFEFSDNELDIDNFRTVNKITEVLFRKTLK